MGSPDDEAGRVAGEGLHRVEIAASYWLADTECTQTLWKAVMGTRPSTTAGDDLPVDSVSWQDCQDFCAKLAAMVPGLRARLPSEAEWEAACRAGSRGAFSGGLAPTALGWSSANAGGRAHAVATRHPNALGLYDMHGNVWEWCQDLDSGYPEVPGQASHTASERMFRGGSWSSEERFCRAAFRGGNASGEGFPGIGLRIAVDADPR
jgi:formylglycine-generating enzyme required for sulfatase activity